MDFETLQTLTGVALSFLRHLAAYFWTKSCNVFTLTAGCLFDMEHVGLSASTLCSGELNIVSPVGLRL